MSARRPVVSLHIERLVLDGLPLTIAQCAHLRASLEGELARLAEAGQLDGASWGGGARSVGEPARDAREPHRPPDVLWEPTRPRQLGRALARSVFASLNLPAPLAAGPRGQS